MLRKIWEGQKSLKRQFLLQEVIVSNRVLHWVIESTVARSIGVGMRRTLVYTSGGSKVFWTLVASYKHHDHSSAD